MAVEIFKDGVKELCTPEQLGYQLQAGYSLTNEPQKLDKPNDNEPEEPVDDQSELSEKDRYLALAKKLGIKPHHKWKLETLIKKVEAALDGD